METSAATADPTPEQDLTDANARAAATALVSRLLVEKPQLPEGGREALRPGTCLVGLGGDGKWENCVIELASHAYPGAAPLLENVLGMLSETGAAWEPELNSPEAVVPFWTQVGIHTRGVWVGARAFPICTPGGLGRLPERWKA